MKIRLQNTNDDEMLLQENIFCQSKFVKADFAGRTDSETNLRVEASVLETEREGKKSSSQV